MAAIHRRGWCDGTGGNFSCVLERRPTLKLLMAPSGVDKGRVKAGELIVVDGGGRVLQGRGRVSAEMPLHRTIVEGTGAGAVLHTHSQAATLLSRIALEAPSTPKSGSRRGARAGRPPQETAPEPSTLHAAADSEVHIAGLEMLKGLEGIRTHESAIAIPVLANDQDLGRLSERASPLLAEAPHGLLIAGHGLYAWGSDLKQALRHLEILEFLLEQHWRMDLWRAWAGERP